MTDHSRMETARDLEEDAPSGRSAGVMWSLRALGVIVALAVYALLGSQEDLTPDGRAVAAIMALMATWWMTEALPLSITSLLPIVLVPALTDRTVGQATSPYASSTIFLFLGGFLLAIAMEKWNLHLRIALMTLKRVGLHPRRMVLGMMLATAFLSMWVSNTATALMMLPIATSVLALVIERSGRRADAQALADGATISDAVKDRDIANFGVCIVLAVAWSASIGGIGTLIGSPPNAIVAGYAAETLGRPIGFVNWMMIGVPLAFVFVFIGWFLMTRVMYRFDLPEIPGGRGLIEEQIRELGPLSQGERMVLLVFLGAAFFWIVPSILASIPSIAAVAPWLGGFDDTATAIAAGILLFILPGRGRTQMLLEWKDAEEGLPWGVLLLFGGGLSLAAAVSATGLDAWFGERVSGLGSLPTVWLVVALAAIVVMVSEIASNTAMAATIVPILGVVAPGIGVDPFLLLVPATLALSLAFMLPVGTPPNAIVFATGRVTMAQMVRGGALMNAVSVVLITLAAYILGPIALGIEF
ncbi:MULTISPECIES: DASS family sodium-coupled anion symporter [unclassified Paracoccus (in: a-proteobacteria)]|uniref:SLC13 family permease n=1 Tax=unclassified Paracoccus (in: a-proteobacteria) TaxID=2688777 RepID=UPI001602B13B|nr:MULTISPECIES: DASS family sodium-coupled anion symporter [unclassified Paracoccus (in: a-proteobacteria)]MBB1491473.1 DASS family sodium-coupled anion symporter [Paracoccus sp. MC1854]MBB1497643.1 DASS family sodium-coupled anion symporter [Paracoccus sp. MC1862]QQO44084.1 DASS family sodium-coupled anion symporter [Paracoccus sp. MC1862]